MIAHMIYAMDGKPATDAMDSMDRRCPKLTASLRAGPLDAETLRKLLDSQRMVKLFEEPWRSPGSPRPGGMDQTDDSDIQWLIFTY